ncbi:MAG: HlyD family efflux transporter periplasmic adaptor subunit [Ruminococcaceae bacterium]|nr:HlyD family efflux transporter periplasmic adaptor subunit [Oscillospiraceae bacterium]
MADFRDERSSNLKKLKSPGDNKGSFFTSSNKTLFTENADSSKKHETKIFRPVFSRKKSSGEKRSKKNLKIVTGSKEKRNTKPPVKKKTDESKNSKSGFIAIATFFGIICALIIFTVVVPRVSSGIKTGYVQNGIIEKSVDGSAVFLRDELTVKSEFSGKVIPAINEGERVAKNDVVAYVVDGEHEQIVEELKQIEDRILSAQTYNDNVSGSVLNGINQVSLAVSAEIQSFTPELSKGSLRNFSDVKSNINSYFNMQNDMSLSIESKNEYIKLLQDKRQDVLNKLSGHMYSLTAPDAGVVSYCLDGNESKVSELDYLNIDFESLEGLDKNYERTTGRDISAGENVFRITTGNDYYIAVTVPFEDGSKIKKDATVTLQALDHSFKALAKVISVTGDGENSLVVLKSSSNMATTISYRVQDVNIIYESVSGMKIPMRALTDWDSAMLTAKVTVIRSNTVYGIYVHVQSYNDEYAIVTNKTSFEDLQETAGLKANDMYVHNPDSVTEGEIIE